MLAAFALAPATHQEKNSTAVRHPLERIWPPSPRDEMAKARGTLAAWGTHSIVDPPGAQYAASRQSSVGSCSRYHQYIVCRDTHSVSRHVKNVCLGMMSPEWTAAAEHFLVQPEDPPQYLPNLRAVHADTSRCTRLSRRTGLPVLRSASHRARSPT
jgi:hypothetical protein